MAISGEGPYLFPSDLNPTGHLKKLKTVWTKTLRWAKIPYFRIYDLRSAYATRLSAGGLADEWVTQLLRQSDASLQEVFADEVADEARIAGEAQPSSQRNDIGGGGRCFFDGAIRGPPMTHSCTVRAQCARITERSGRGNFSNSFTIRKKLVDVTGIEPVTPCLQSRCSPS